MIVRALFVVAAIASAQSSDEDLVRGVVTRFADARNAHDGATAANTYSEHGEYINVAGRHIRGRYELATLWGGVIGKVTRNIESVEMIPPGLAIVRVHAHYANAGAIGDLSETFILIQEESSWKIHIHHASLIPH